ncbi:helix-turn-helix transcriptional regulator [Candidatus Enterococcus mansonii]|uniref:Helix-turn-helix type 11 domain-containing protein n=1 Tax=Candidatus Enterococcus mansonii TaxID=1834181 RepID=A0A242CIQ7_9ENTE|nr:WYL domain-containing protein [Enterococcus sp. 4G2_DIV0659]OTO10124.1 hypothetical protein A5880_000807 [Enterococcus sp. 4G2_DIV0659]
MKKAERINDMILYLADKKSFNLKELMKRYAISKSTALRDVISLEEIGLPLYSELGRYGKYKILDTSIAVSNLFTEGEIYALYFALLTLNVYQSSPFNMETSTLELKFSKALPEKVKNDLLLMNKIITLEQTNHSNVSHYLKEIVQGTIQEKVYKLTYLKNQEKVSIIAQFIEISSKFGQWYAKIWNLEVQEMRVIRCDKIDFLVEEKAYPSLALKELLKRAEEFYQKEKLIPFTVTVDERGKDIFTKESYPSMKIEKQKDFYVIKGYYHKGEKEFITNYLLLFGKSILTLEPGQLKKAVLKKAEAVMECFKQL